MSKERIELSVIAGGTKFTTGRFCIVVQDDDPGVGDNCLHRNKLQRLR
jgi:hypothetical protein